MTPEIIAAFKAAIDYSSYPKTETDICIDQQIVEYLKQINDQFPFVFTWVSCEGHLKAFRIEEDEFELPSYFVQGAYVTLGFLTPHHRDRFLQYLLPKLKTYGDYVVLALGSDQPPDNDDDHALVFQGRSYFVYEVTIGFPDVLRHFGHPNRILEEDQNIVKERKLLFEDFVIDTLKMMKREQEIQFHNSSYL